MSHHSKSCCFIFLNDALALSKPYSFLPSQNNSENNCNTPHKKPTLSCVHHTPHQRVLKSPYRLT